MSLDDYSEATQTVIAFKKMISEEKVDAFIGPNGSPNAMGIIQFVAESGTPMLAPVGTHAVVLPMTAQKKWVFKTSQNDDITAKALDGQMVKEGVKTAGFIGFKEDHGDKCLKVFNELAKADDI